MSQTSKPILTSSMNTNREERPYHPTANTVNRNVYEPARDASLPEIPGGYSAKSRSETLLQPAEKENKFAELNQGNKIDGKGDQEKDFKRLFDPIAGGKQHHRSDYMASNPNRSGQEDVSDNTTHAHPGAHDKLPDLSQNLDTRGQKPETKHISPVYRKHDTKDTPKSTSDNYVLNGSNIDKSNEYPDTEPQKQSSFRDTGPGTIEKYPLDLIDSSSDSALPVHDNNSAFSGTVASANRKRVGGKSSASKGKSHTGDNSNKSEYTRGPITTDNAHKIGAGNLTTERPHQQASHRVRATDIPEPDYAIDPHGRVGENGIDTYGYVVKNDDLFKRSRNIDNPIPSKTRDLTEATTPGTNSQSRPSDKYHDSGGVVPKSLQTDQPRKTGNISSNDRRSKIAGMEGNPPSVKGRYPQISRYENANRVGSATRYTSKSSEDTWEKASNMRGLETGKEGPYPDQLPSSQGKSSLPPRESNYPNETKELQRPANDSNKGLISSMTDENQTHPTKLSDSSSRVSKGSKTRGGASPKKDSESTTSSGSSWFHNPFHWGDRSPKDKESKASGGPNAGIMPDLHPKYPQKWKQADYDSVSLNESNKSALAAAERKEGRPLNASHTFPEENVRGVKNKSARDAASHTSSKSANIQNISNFGGTALPGDQLPLASDRPLSSKKAYNEPSNTRPTGKAASLATANTNTGPSVDRTTRLMSSNVRQKGTSNKTPSELQNEGPSTFVFEEDVVKQKTVAPARNAPQLSDTGRTIQATTANEPILNTGFNNNTATPHASPPDRPSAPMNAPDTGFVGLKQQGVTRDDTFDTVNRPSYNQTGTTGTIPFKGQVKEEVIEKKDHEIRSRPRSEKKVAPQRRSVPETHTRSLAAGTTPLAAPTSINEEDDRATASAIRDSRKIHPTQPGQKLPPQTPARNYPTATTADTSRNDRQPSLQEGRGIETSFAEQQQQGFYSEGHVPFSVTNPSVSAKAPPPSGNTKQYRPPSRDGYVATTNKGYNQSQFVEPAQSAPRSSKKPVAVSSGDTNAIVTAHPPDKNTDAYIGVVPQDPRGIFYRQRGNDGTPDFSEQHRVQKRKSLAKFTNSRRPATDQQLRGKEDNDYVIDSGYGGEPVMNGAARKHSIGSGKTYVGAIAEYPSLVDPNVNTYGWREKKVGDDNAHQIEGRSTGRGAPTQLSEAPATNMATTTGATDKRPSASSSSSPSSLSSALGPDFVSKAAAFGGADSDTAAGPAPDSDEEDLQSAKNYVVKGSNLSLSPRVVSSTTGSESNYESTTKDGKVGAGDASLIKTKQDDTVPRDMLEIHEWKQTLKVDRDGVQTVEMTDIISTTSPQKGTTAEQ